MRRLIGRLCAAGLGLDPQLDDELTALAAANRRNADAVELERLAKSLTSAVVTLDATSPLLKILAPFPPASAAAGPRRWDSTCAAVAGVLARLKTGGPDDLTAQRLIAELPGAQTDATLAAIVVRVADMIRDRGESLARERLQAAAVLSEVTKRLEEMAGYLTESSSASRNHFDDTQSLNDTVMSHVRELTDEASGATELALLQSTVSARLQSVTQQVCDFRIRERARLMEYNGRAERMRARIADLEREAQELHSKLDLEKHGARLDPLTGVANRKSFDERFAREIAGRAQGGSPLVMLLWDIDSFKVINDSYGHRAGDRVLQTVAGCFKTVLRAGDFVARIGGEEFAVLLAGIALSDAVNIANQVRTAHIEGCNTFISAGLGARNGLVRRNRTESG